MLKLVVWKLGSPLSPMMAESPRPSSVPTQLSQRSPSPRTQAGRKKKSTKSYHPFKDQAGKRGDGERQKKKTSKRSAHHSSDMKSKGRSDGPHTAHLARTWSVGSATSASSAATSVAGSVPDHLSLESLDGSDRSLDSLLFLEPTGACGDKLQDADRRASELVKQPADLPEGWLMHRTADGKPYFVNQKERSTTWLDPRTSRPVAATQQHGLAPATVTDEFNVPLPKGWEIGVTANGTRYFIDHVSRKTSWTDPRLAIMEQARLGGQSSTANGMSGMSVSAAAAMTSNATTPTASSLEAQRQQLRLQQLKLANSEIQLQIEMIRKQQAILEREMLQSASPETIKLAKTKAQADAYSILSLKAQHDTVQRQIDSRMMSLQRCGLDDLPEGSTSTFGLSGMQSQGIRAGPADPHSASVLADSGSRQRHRRGSSERIAEEFALSGALSGVTNCGPSQHTAKNGISGIRDSASNTHRWRSPISGSSGADYCNVKIEGASIGEGTASGLTRSLVSLASSPHDGDFVLPELDSPLIDPTGGLGLDFELGGDLDSVGLSDGIGVTSGAQGGGVDAFFGSWCV